MNIRARTLGLLTIVSWLCLNGCSTNRDAPPGAELEIIDWVGLASHWTGLEDYRVEIVTFHDLKRSDLYQVRYDIELTKQSLTMVAQTPLGILLYELEVSEGKMTTKNHVDQLKGLPVEQTLADFVLVYWPLDQLMEAAVEAGYSIRQADTIRQLLNSEAEILVEVIKESEGNEEVTRVIHHDVPLRIDIRTASVRQGYQ